MRAEMPDEDEKAIVSDWHLAEYNALKAEQRDRIKYRDGLFFAAFVFYGALGAYALQPSSPVDIWLLLGFVAGLAGHMYQENEVKISGIRDFLKKEHKVHLKWETEIDSEKRRWVRKLFQTVVDILAFGGPAVFCTMLAMPTELQVLPGITKVVVGLLGVYVVARSIFRWWERYV